MPLLKLRPGSLPAGMPFWHPASLTATWFGTGLMPFAPGSWGSLAALPFAWVIDSLFDETGLLVAVVLVSLAGWWAANVITRRSGVRDPGLIVVDEVAGMWLTLIAAPQTWWGYALAFVMFRIADIIKPWPASWCDRRIHGGLGVMLDDLVAAIYAGLWVWLLTHYAMIQDVARRLVY